jgi:hypothetical protein
MGDRLSAAAVGLIFGGIIGFALAWLLGVYSNTLGPSDTAESPRVPWRPVGLSQAATAEV